MKSLTPEAGSAEMASSERPLPPAHLALTLHPGLTNKSNQSHER
jgi:hypothetical protein